jgi:alpha-L-fucosidase
MKRAALALLVSLLGVSLGAAPAVPNSRNKPERLEWFRDLGFGMFIHWSVDGPLGGVISHSLVGASDDFSARFFSELPKGFNPRKFHPADWAELAKLAGMKYVVFTTKHHAGFCMFDTETTDFDVMSTPFKRDITKEVVDAFRAQGIAVGFYFSPDDFWYLHHKAKVPMARAPHKGVTPAELPGLLAHDQAQIRELLTRYGKIDFLFIDGPAEGLRELAWDLQPDLVVTRGAIETPEQRIPGVPMDRPWEACLTMGTEWNYKPYDETYKSASEVLAILIETRAKGGNLLLNVGPKPDGELPLEQDERLRKVAFWNFVNGEAIDAVRPWVVTNEGDVWFTKKKNEDTVYAILTRMPTVLGDRKKVTLRSVKATPATTISVLGHAGKILEYRPDVDPKPTFTQDDKGLHLDVVMGQRLATNRQWVEPMVVKLTGVKPAFTAPVALTLDGLRRDGTSGTLRADVKDLGGASSVEVAFQYRRLKGVDELYTKDEEWVSTPPVARRALGAYEAVVSGLKPEDAYHYRAVVKHPLLTVYGEDRVLEKPPSAAPRK